MDRLTLKKVVLSVIVPEDLVGYVQSILDNLVLDKALSSNHAHAEVEEPTPKEIEDVERCCEFNESWHKIGQKVQITGLLREIQGRPNLVDEDDLFLEGTIGTVTKIRHGWPLPYRVEFDNPVAGYPCTEEHPTNSWYFGRSEIKAVEPEVKPKAVKKKRK